MLNIQSILFILVTCGVTFVAWKRYGKLRRNILLGKAESTDGPSSSRWKNVFLVALGQKKMFKRWIPALLHGFIYVAFLLTQIELIEIIIDGVTGSHRWIYMNIPFLRPLYLAIINSIEVLSLLAFVATFIFLIRRNLLKIPRFKMSEMTGWPTLDGNLILYGEILLVIGIFCMNVGDQAYMAHGDGAPYRFWLSGMIADNINMMSSASLHAMERFGWWLHIMVVFAFILYLPYSKHLHIFLAFINTYYAKLTSRGQMEEMPAVTKEVKALMSDAAFDESEASEEIPKFGASDITDFSWKTILSAYSCTECGRCSSVCPASQTGKKLSPRKVMMDIRDRAEEIGNNLDSGDLEFVNDKDKPLTIENYSDGKDLFERITIEELRACTTCNACVEACPVLIDPLEPILALRRHLILDKADAPEAWNMMFSNIENNGAPWAFPMDQRGDWVNDLN